MDGQVGAKVAEAGMRRCMRRSRGGAEEGYAKEVGADVGGDFIEETPAVVVVEAQSQRSLSVVEGVEAGDVLPGASEKGVIVGLEGVVDEVSSSFEFDVLRENGGGISETMGEAILFRKSM